jgi:hypothetical protein
MKKFILFVFCFISIKGFTQGINFQGVARTANGTIIAGSNISLRLSIISKNVDGTPEFVETKKVVTNTQGIFSIVVGDSSNSNVTGSFKNIVWSDGPKFLKVEMDPAGGFNYINMGATQLQYVPYSFYSFGVDASNIKGMVPIKSGGTGSESVEQFKTNFSLDKVNNTLDIDKPVSKPIQTALDLKLSKSDTISLSNRINNKLSYADTLTLSNRIDGKLSSSNAIFATDIVVNGLTVGLSGGQFGNSTAFGKSALKNNTIGGGNTAIGSNALSENINSSGNTAVGSNALAKSTGSSNTSIGSDNMRLNTTGSYNTSVGAFSFYSNTTGSNNIGMGRGHLYNNTTGNSNIAIGNDALEKNTTADNNIAIGTSVLNKNTVGSRNTAVGVGALNNNVSGSVNNAFGYLALTNSTASENNAFGHQALTNNTTGTLNSAFGHNALSANIIGSGNTAMGYAALGSNLSENNTAIGLRSLQFNTSGSNNASLGKESLDHNTTGSGNTAVGAIALFANTTGSNNTAIGKDALSQNVNYSNSTGIGFNAQVTGSNQVQIGNSDVTLVNTNGVVASKSGFLPPRLTAAQRDALISPEQGLIIFCINCGAIGEMEYYSGDGWTNMSGGSTAAVDSNVEGVLTGLVANFPLNNTPNSSVGNYTGTVNGVVTYTTDRKGVANGAMQGGSGYITASSSIFSFTRSATFSVSIWFTADAVTSSGRLLSTENPEGNFRISKYDLNNIAVQFGDYIRYDVTNAEWHHLVYTYNNNLEKVYIDGNLVATNTDSSTEALNYGSPFTIGAKAASAFDRWAGKIDDVRIYNRALAEYEVKRLFKL